MARFSDKEKPKNLTVLGKKTNFDGVLKFTEELHIEGVFNGTIDAEGNLRIKKNAICTATHITAASIIVEGTVKADMSAADKIDIKAGSDVKGNLVSSRLRIADGVKFEGSVEMIKTDAEFNIFESNAENLKQQLTITEKKENEKQENEELKEKDT